MRFKLVALFRGQAEMIFDQRDRKYAAIPRSVHGERLVAEMNRLWSAELQRRRAAPQAMRRAA